MATAQVVAPGGAGGGGGNGGALVPAPAILEVTEATAAIGLNGAVGGTGGSGGEAKAEHLLISRPLEPQRLRTAHSRATRSGAVWHGEKPESVVAGPQAAAVPMEARHPEAPQEVAGGVCGNGGDGRQRRQRRQRWQRSTRLCGSETLQGASMALPIRARHPH